MRQSRKLNRVMAPLTTVAVLIGLVFTGSATSIAYARPVNATINTAAIITSKVVTVRSGSPAWASISIKDSGWGRAPDLPNQWQTHCRDVAALKANITLARNCYALLLWLAGVAKGEAEHVDATGYERGGWGPPTIPDALLYNAPATAWYRTEYARWSAVGWCIIGHESLDAGGPVAQNPNGNASGWFQFEDGTWGRFMGYLKARFAPSNVQWWRFFEKWAESAGSSAWNGTHCGYGMKVDKRQ